jgi:hypothetical protein
MEDETFKKISSEVNRLHLNRPKLYGATRRKARMGANSNQDLHPFVAENML